MKYFLSFAIFLALYFSPSLSAQSIILKGVVVDEEGQPIELVNVAITNQSGGTISDEKGLFSLNLPLDTAVVLVFSHLLYHKDSIKIVSKTQKTLYHRQVLSLKTTQLQEIQVFDFALKNANLERLNRKGIDRIVATTNAVEAMVKLMPGVSSNNGMSSQYTVRGGNYDENLLYINNIEIHRPLTLVNGQEEGLSLINPDMTASVLFSAGGFGANYGDKMSSVLDVKYRKPSSFGGIFSASFLEGTAQIESLSKKKKLTHNTAIRYRNTSLLLNNLDIEGNYAPSAFDFQTYLTYAIRPKWSVELLSNWNNSRYTFLPSFRKTATGAGNMKGIAELRTYLKGEHKISIDNGFVIANLVYQKNKNTQLRFQINYYQSSEQVHKDFRGDYNIITIDANINSGSFGDSIDLVTQGSLADFIDNQLNTHGITIGHDGTRQMRQHRLQWGFQAQYRQVEHNWQEYFMNDSTLRTFTLADTALFAREFIQTDHHLTFYNSSIFFMDTYTLNMGAAKGIWSAGLRANYLNYTSQLTLSPRISLTFIPNKARQQIFRLAIGHYWQPPFYRELLNRQGHINPKLKAQSSTHLIIGADFYFQLLKRPFKLTSEIYYKNYTNLIPYYFEDIRMHYYGKNNAKGYAIGIDTRFYGEFIKGVESWFTISIMKTAENILDDAYFDSNTQQLVDPQYIPRPTDRRLNLSLFFQDELPMLPSMQAYVSMIFGSGLPFGNPKAARHHHTLRMGDHRRLDIGLTKVFKPKQRTTFKEVVLGLELLNVWNVKNTVAHEWFTFDDHREVGVPYTTAGRRINAKLVVKI